MNKLLYPFLLLFSLTFFFFHTISIPDPDFGWHLRLGETITSSGIPGTDPFSFTMPSFPLVEHEWLIDVLYAKLYPAIGQYGLGVLFTVIALTAILVAVKSSSAPGILLLILATSSFEPFFTISPKVVSWLLFALVNFIVFNKKTWAHRWYFVPLIVLFWANIHGSFPVALVALLVIFAVRTVEYKKIMLKELLVLFLSFLATLINPFGWRIWEIVIATVSSKNVTSELTEWQPAYLALSHLTLLFFMLLAISGVLIVRYRNRFSKEQIILNLMLLISTAFAVRNIHLWVIFSLPMTYQALTFLQKDIGNKKVSLDRLSRTYKILSVFGFFFMLYQLGNVIYLRNNPYAVNKYYPVAAVNYLHENLPRGQIFAEYKWGGYLVRELPEKKVFIYGMMPAWENGNAPDKESKSAMKDYLDITRDKTDYKPAFEKFDINTVLLDNTPKKLSDKLQNDGWEVVYKDGAAVIYKK